MVSRIGREQLDTLCEEAIQVPLVAPARAVLLHPQYVLVPRRQRVLPGVRADLHLKVSDKRRGGEGGRDG